MNIATNILKAYSRFRLNQINNLNPVEQQKKELFKLIYKAKDTQFGKEHNFSTISNISEYQKRVKPRKYEDFWEEYWKDNFPVINNVTWPGTIPYLPVTSGTTTGTTKYIPLTKEMIQSNSKAGTDLLCYHLANFPNSKLLSGKTFFLGGSASFVKEAEGVYSGDLSGIASSNIPLWTKPFFFPPHELTLMSDWEEKINTFAEKALQENITLISGVPSWMLILIGKLFELKPEAEGLLQNVFPNLEVIIHGGVNFAPYYKQFSKLTEGSQIQFREVYPATEGFMATADRGYGEGLRLNLDNGIFYEFIPLEELKSENPTRHWIGNIEKDINYAIALTTCAGAWSYILGDTVKFIDTDPPRLLITGRTSYTLSAFAEHLIADEIEDGISTASNDINYSVTDYSVAPVYPKDASDLGGHKYVVEFVEGTPSKQELDRFVKILDRRISERNEDYEAHRSDGFGLKAPEVLPAKPGMFAAWMKSRGKLGGQHKVPRIINDQDLFKNLLDFHGDY